MTAWPPTIHRMAGSRPDCAIFYYAPYEWTTYRKLQAKYPGVCSASDIDRLFERPETVDLYTDIVKKLTEWPTRDMTLIDSVPMLAGPEFRKLMREELKADPGAN